ncbi:uncharacterized protein [Miscanthus floridulus]|uniref:uncharacterized protein isoform X1 n=1 Tax=Miscanthus floridulus TaxID=154761 RepID=UPI0034586362
MTDDVDLNEPILEDDTINGFDLNLPLDDFGAVDFDYLQNLAADDDDGNLALDLNEAENDDGDAGFDLNEPEDDEHGIEQHADQVNQPKHDYSDHVRQQVYQALLMRSKNGKLGKQDTTIVGAQFGVKIRSVQRIWKQDLGFFRAIQAIQYKKNAKTMQDIIPAVQQAFMEYSPQKANMIFVTLQTVLKEAMKIKGYNKIKIPHMNKQRLEREDRLPLQVPCEASLLAEALATLPA